MSQVFESRRQPEPQSTDFEFLNIVEPFTVFPERWLSLMAGLMRVETFAKGELIFRAGDVSDVVYVLRRGQVVLFTDTVGEPVHLMARVHSGEMFGEVGVLERSRRRVSARAATPARLLCLQGADLGRLGRASRRFGARLAQSALLRYMRDSASAAERGQRGDVRIRVDRPITLQSGECPPIFPRLDNLSQGGACLRDVPEGWELEGPETVKVGLEGDRELFQVPARIAWRSGTSLGLAFGKVSPDHDVRIDAALDALLSSGWDPAVEPANWSS